MMDRRQHIGHARVINAPFNADCPLRHGGQHILGRNRCCGHLVQQTQTGQTGHGQKSRVGHPVAQLFHPRLHIAAKLDHVQMRKAMQQLRPAAQRRRADLCPFGQIRQCGVVH